MKLCKACNQIVETPNWIFCNREVCLQARKALAKIRYKKPLKKQPYFSYDERHNWICECADMKVIPAKYNLCAACGAKPRDFNSKKKRVFIPEKHAVDIARFVDDYFNKQDEIIVRHLSVAQ